MVLEVPEVLSEEEEGRAEACFGHLLQALKKQHIRIGGGKSRGQGKARLVDCKVCYQDLLTREGILRTLRGGGFPVEISELCVSAEVSLKSSPRLYTEVAWEPQGAVMTKAPGEGMAVNIIPMTTGIGKDLTLVLPGSSIKGALRSQAERIVRTLLPKERLSRVAHEPDPPNFEESLQVPLVDWIFGTTAKACQLPTRERRGLSSGESATGAGALSVEDCHLEKKIPRSRWRAVVDAEDDQVLQRALNDAGIESFSHAYHVAVDRWTGGAGAGFLFSTLEPRGIAWEPLRFEFDLLRLPEDLQGPALALIFLLLGDLASGRITLGYGANRGMGGIEVKSVRLRGEDLPEALAKLETLELAQGSLDKVPKELRQALAESWKKWISSMREGDEA
jgi:CRISPR/Cas system CSM-associated protein Csm3 (group 7 of RAMP superfamily)